MRPALLLSLLAASLASACPAPRPPSDSSALDASPDTPAPDTPAPDAPPARPLRLIARFDPAPVAPATRPAPGAIPFPSDLYLEPDGTVVDDLTDFRAFRLPRGTEALADALRDMDGFGRNAGALFILDGQTAHDGDPVLDVDPASLPATAAASLAPDASAFVLDLSPDATPATARVPVVAGWHRAFRTVTVAPDGVTLRAGHRYAFVLTTAVRTLTTPPVALEPAPAFVALRDDAPGARATPLGQLYGPALDRVLSLLPAGFDRTRIAALAVFTTQTRHRELRAAADAVRAGRVRPPPALNTDATAAAPYTVVRFGAAPHAGWTATLEEWLGAPLRGADGRDLPGEPWAMTEGPNVGMAHDALGAILTGTFEAPDFRGANGRIALAPDGTPTPARPAQIIPVTFALPRGPVPPGGFPVVLWGHGLGNHRRSLLAVANEMARRGIATVAIDHVTFGQRAFPVDTTSLQNGTYRGPDGIGDSADYPPAEFFGNLTGLVAMRDNLRQAALDQVQLRRLVTNPALDLSFVAAEYGGTAPALDRAHVAYMGDSLGGIIGALFASIEPDVNPVVLNVPGGAIFTAIGPDAPELNILVSVIPGTVFGAPVAPVDRFHPVANLLQMALDRADPASVAADITAPPAAGGRGHDVWVVEALWDEIIANRATELLAREMGLPQIAPVAIAAPGFTVATPPLRANLPGGATGGFLQMTPATHGANIATRYGTRSYAAPFPNASGADRFTHLAQPYRIRQSIVGYQRAIAAFLASAFAGTPTLSIEGMELVPDTDDDGFTDAEETAAATNPNDPSSHPAGPPPHPRNLGF